ncbi:MAG: MerR family transcriptional regulator [Pseudomonadota bacterium]
MTELRSDQTESVKYRIGVASRLSGVAAHTLRKWEERHQIVAPTRTRSGERLYSEAQVRYLARLKTLIEAGLEISDLVDLSEDDLQATEQRVLADAGFPEREIPTPSVTVVGRHVGEFVRQHGDRLSRLSIEQVLDDSSDQTLTGIDATHLLICDQVNVTNETPASVDRLLAATGARAAIVLYQFGARWVLDELRSSRVAVARMPVDPADLQRLALGLWYEVAGWPTIVLGSDEDADAPPARFSEGALMRVSNLSSAMRCECPNHIADLLMAVMSFEAYSATCEVEQPADAAEHRYLRVTAASARMLFEDALVRLARAEGISLYDLGDA